MENHWVKQYPSIAASILMGSADSPAPTPPPQMIMLVGWKICIRNPCKIWLSQEANSSGIMLWSEKKLSKILLRGIWCVMRTWENKWGWGKKIHKIMRCRDGPKISHWSAAANPQHELLSAGQQHSELAEEAHARVVRDPRTRIRQSLGNSAQCRGSRLSGGWLSNLFWGWVFCLQAT